MKTILIVLTMMFAWQAHAQEVIATVANEGGGKILLMKDRGACGIGQGVIYSVLPNGDNKKGCWKTIGNYVHVTYEGGVTRMYDGLAFTLDDFYKKKYEAAKPKEM